MTDDRMRRGGDSEDDPTFVSLVGIPRSGTTWMQQLLNWHPQVGTGQESFLFARFIVPQLREFRWGLAQSGRGGLGLAAYMSEETFLSELRRHVAALRQQMVEVCYSEKKTASLFLDKSPPNALVMEEIHEISPEVRFVVMIRNAYDIVASWRRSSRTWAPWLVPDRVGEMANIVCAYVHAIERALAVLEPREVLIVRYEELWERPVTTLLAVCRFIGIEWDEAGVRAALDALEPDVARALEHMHIPLWGAARTKYGSAALNPPGFVGPATPGAGWRTLCLRDRRTIRAVLASHGLTAELVPLDRVGGWSRYDLDRLIRAPSGSVC